MLDYIKVIIKTVMLDLELMFSSDNKYYNKILNSIKDQDLICLNYLILKKRFKNLSNRDQYDIIYKLIRYNNLDTIKIIFNPSIEYSRNERDRIYKSMEYSIQLSNHEIFHYLFDNFKIDDSYDMDKLLINSIRYYNINEHHKEIFKKIFITKNVNNYVLIYDIINTIICHNNLELFEFFLKNEVFKKIRIKTIYNIIVNIIEHNNIQFFQKIIYYLDIDLSFDKNLLLKKSIINNSDDITLILLNDENVISPNNKSSLYTSLLYLIAGHNGDCKKLNILKKILDIDFIDVSTKNNNLLIKSIFYQKYDIMDIILNDKKLDLSKNDKSFNVINNMDVINLRKIVNFNILRKYMNYNTKMLVKPNYENKKINRVIYE